MIRYFIRHYWRYLAMALAFATISFFVNSCDVRAEGNFISPANFRFINSPSNDSIASGGCANEMCDFTIEGRSRGGYFNNYNATHSFTGVNLVMFNGSISGESETGIASIDFLTNPCFFVQNQIISDDDYSEQERLTEFSAYCPISNTDNIGTLTISPNQRLIGISYSEGRNVSHLKISKIKIVQDTWGTEIIRLLNESNGYWATNQGILTRVETILRQQLTNEDIVNGYLNTIQGYINQQNSKLDAMNSKLEELIENNQVCKVYDKNSISQHNKALGGNGQIVDSQAYGVTDFIKITKTSKIKKISNGNPIYFAIGIYNINKANLQITNNGDIPLNQVITLPNGASYIRFSIDENQNQPQWEICDTAQNIQNQQNEEIINSQKETNDTLKDSSTDDPTNDLNDMNENEISNSVISDLLLLPINMFQNILNAVNGTCSNFSLGALFGTTLVLPCINIENIIGSSLWGVIDILFCGIFVLSIRKKFVDIFENITSLKDRGNELE